MKIEPVEAYRYRFCNECNSQNNVKEVYIGKSIITLCKDCRKNLSYELLEDYIIDEINQFKKPTASK